MPNEMSQRSSAHRIEAEIIADSPAAQLSMLCRQRRIALANAALNLNCEGAVVEFGAGAGGSYSILRQSVPDRKIWVYDSWKGLPALTAMDSGTIATEGSVRRGKISFWATLLHFNIQRPDQIVSEEIGSERPAPRLPGKIALAFVDLDLYHATATVLRLIVPVMAARGVIVVDDYSPRFPGVIRAVDEFLARVPAECLRTEGTPDDLVTIYLP